VKTAAALVARLARGSGRSARRRRRDATGAGFAPIAPLVEAAIARHELPGAVVLVGRGDEILYHRAFGTRAVAPRRADDRRHHLRPRLADQGGGDDDERDDAGREGRIRLSDPVALFIPEFGRYGKSGITIRTC
jgi:CubicO group peptidase (beta-lactamase class C family)